MLQSRIPNQPEHNKRNPWPNSTWKIFRKTTETITYEGFRQYSNPDKKREKLDLKFEKCILVGYSLESKGYKCFDPSTHKVYSSRDLVFDESASWYAPTTQTPEVSNIDSKEKEKSPALKKMSWHEDPSSTRGTTSSENIVPTTEEQEQNDELQERANGQQQWLG